MPATDTKKLVIKLFDVDIDQVPLESFTGFWLFEFLCELFAGVVPLHIVVFIMECFYKYTDIVVATEKVLELLLGLFFEGLTDGAELFFSVDFFAEEVVDSVEAASEGEVGLVFEVWRGLWLYFHCILRVFQGNKK